MANDDDDPASIDEVRMAELCQLGIGGDEAVDIVAFERGLRCCERVCNEAHQAVTLVARMLGIAKDAQVIALLDRLSAISSGHEIRSRFYPIGWLTTPRSAGIHEEYGRICFTQVTMLPRTSHIALFMFEKDGIRQLAGMRVDMANEVVLDEIDGADNVQIRSDARRLVEVALNALLA